MSLKAANEKGRYGGSLPYPKAKWTPYLPRTVAHKGLLITRVQCLSVEREGECRSLISWMRIFGALDGMQVSGTKDSCE